MFLVGLAIVLTALSLYEPIFQKFKWLLILTVSIPTITETFTVSFHLKSYRLSCLTLAGEYWGDLLRKWDILEKHFYRRKEPAGELIYDESSASGR